MRALLVVVVVVVVLAAGCNSDLVLPDDVNVGDIAGASPTDWWLGLPEVDAGEFALDAALARMDGELSTFKTIDVCRGGCRHIGYGGGGLLALDNASEGIQLANTGGVVETLTFPLDEAVQQGPWLLAGRGAHLVAAAGLHVFERDGRSWIELAELDFAAVTIAVESGDVVVVRRRNDALDRVLPAVLVDGAWVNHDDEIEEGALVSFAFDGSFTTSSSLAPPEDADAFVPLRMFAQGLLGARLVGTAVDAVVVDPTGVRSWASLGNIDGALDARAFRATEFDDGSVGLLYPGSRREQGAGARVVLHVDTW